MGFKVFAGCLFNKGDGAEALKRICSDQLHVLQLDVRDPEQVDCAYGAVEEKLNDYGENSLNKIKTNSLSIWQKIFTYVEKLLYKMFEAILIMYMYI